MVNRTLILAAPVLGVLLCACGSEIRTDVASVPGEATELPAATPEPESAGHDENSAAVSLTLTTVLYSEHDAELTARRQGVVSEINVELGDAIERGQELARLDDGTEQVAVEAAAAAITLATAQHERARKLAESGMITTAELDSATFRLQSAQAALADATVRLEYTRIRSLFAGAVTRRFIRIGQTVREGDPLFRTTALQPLRALVRVPEERAAALGVGAQVRLLGVAGQPATGRILRISPAVDPGSGTVEVLIDVPRPGGLRPGSTVRIELGGERGTGP